MNSVSRCGGLLVAAGALVLLLAATCFAAAAEGRHGEGFSRLLLAAGGDTSQVAAGVAQATRQSARLFCVDS